jgi:SAM-dependent methyltransferase
MFAPARDFWEWRRRKDSCLRIATVVADGAIDVLRIHDDGTIAAEGWAPDLQALVEALRLNIDGVDIPPSHAFRVPRPDVEGIFGKPAGFLGALVEWALPPSSAPQQATFKAAPATAISITLPPFGDVPYAGLRTDRVIRHRDEIYGVGPPVPIVSNDVLHLARSLPPPILDFGCGAGALVRALRHEGLEIYGVELDNDRIRTHLLPEVQPFVTLYDGSLPSPFADGQFRSVICSEVLEHLPTPERFVAEFVRLATDSLLVTVPDMSAIPRLFSHGAVPWHLLEASHVNFFTQHSLESSFAPHAARMVMNRLHPVQCDRARFYTNLALMVELTGRRS